MGLYVPFSELSDEARTLDHAITSLMEELEAINYYHQRADVSADKALKDLMIHNRNEEIEHATMLFEWLRRAMPEFDGEMRKYLFTQAPITEVESSASEDASGGSLGIGSLRR
ncbi:MAG: ferritin-like domain-containing protein [Synergistaceae bacterium]|nr:ferritin-like domain-containing protein [Synergistaceae bacterium]